MLSTQRLAAVAAAIFVSGLSASVSAAQPYAFTVDCTKGQTISGILGLVTDNRPLVVTIKGTCNENVTISRDDVTLQGDPKGGATISGSSAGSTITVRASRVLIDRLNVRGGNPFGIQLVGGSNVDISNSDVQYAASQGINVQGTSWVNITKCSVQHNTRAGIGVAQANVAITDSQISHNSGAGVIGVWDASMSITNSQFVSNATSGVRAIRHSSVTLNASTISSSGQLGVELRASEGAINDTTITANGTGGVGVNASNVHFNGGAVTNNVGTGVLASGPSYVDLYGTSVSGNGGSNFGPNAGVGLYLGAVANISGATISGNKAEGLWVWVNSTAQVSGGAIIQNNAGHGIQLNADSKLWMNGPATVGGNAGSGVNCLDTKSSAYNLASITYSPSNGGGTTNCTGS